jgi:hypothetical protein
LVAAILLINVRISELTRGRPGPFDRFIQKL